MTVSLARLPKYLVLEPVSTVRLEMELTQPSCEIDVELQNPQPGRSFVLLIGKQGGPHLQRMRLSGRARILFDPKLPGVYVLMLANPQKDPLVLKLRARNIFRGRKGRASASRRAQGAGTGRGHPEGQAGRLPRSRTAGPGTEVPAGRRSRRNPAASSGARPPAPKD